jgi:hypothetical protein
MGLRGLLWGRFTLILACGATLQIRQAKLIFSETEIVKVFLNRVI